MSAKENDELIKEGQSAYYGYFERYLWRNEKNGNCFFRMYTKQEMLFPQQYQKSIIRRNRVEDMDETWYSITCDGSKINIPFFEKNIPLKVTGYFQTDSESGDAWDFKVTSAEVSSQDDTVTINYLASAGFDSIGYEEAVQIVHLHPDFFEFIKGPESGRILSQETGIPVRVVRNIINQILESEAEREVFRLLSPFDISYSAAAKAVRYYGQNAAQKLQMDPYQIGHKIGLSFRQCDEIAFSWETPSVKTGRIRAASYTALDILSSNGDTWTCAENFYRIVSRLFLSGPYGGTIPFTVALPCLKDIIGHAEKDDMQILYKKSVFKAEQRVAQNLIRLSRAKEKEDRFSMSLIDYAEEACRIKYGTHQRAAFPVILASSGLKLINGGPGTGKTTAIKGILLAYQKIHPDRRIALCAPTGRAAQRMSESTGMPATTVHRLLDYRPYGDTEMHKDRTDPIPADLIIIDEMSMMDIELFDIFLEAVETGTTLVFVGDKDQLEAVGPGAVFRDLLSAHDDIVEKVMLKEIFRQAEDSPIIGNAQKINNGDISLSLCDNFQVLHTKNEDESLEQVMKLMKEMYDPEAPFDTQILCPSRKGTSGIFNINMTLQALLNLGTEGIQYGATMFRENDKVIMSRNNYMADYYNGDIGIVSRMENRRIYVNIREKEIELKRDMLDDVHLCYGMTIHKSQGSEFKNVIIVMPMEPKGMLVRNLLYTAVTRAKKRVIVINEGSAMETAIKKSVAVGRKTMLSQYLEKYAAEL